VPGPGADLLQRAAAILTRESASATPAASPGQLDFAGREADVDRLRRYAYELVDTFLAVFSPKGPVGSADAQVPLLRAPSPVRAGGEASVAVRVANEEPQPSTVTLYTSNFVSDSGHEIPSLRVTCVPRTLTIAPNAQATFEVKIAIPQQAARGLYSGVVQAAGLTYVKAVISLEVL
jgi:hypothetical protein